jgi:NADP-dependent 3-hydroxy acid dehydrogenase YdfG
MIIPNDRGLNYPFFRQEFANRKVRSTLIEPGAVATELTTEQVG